MNNQKLKDLFFQHLKIERQYSENTIKSYELDLKLFDREMEIDYLRVTLEDAKKYIRYLRDNFSNNTVLRKTACLKSFYKFLETNDLINENPFTLISNSKKKLNIPKYLSIKEMNLFLNSLEDSTPIDIRDKAMFELLYATGMRISELINLELKDLNLEEKVVIVTGKGNKSRLIPINETAIKSLSIYITSSRLKLLKTLNNILFINYNGDKLTRQGITKILKQKALRVGIDNISAHKFRHSIATHMLNSGANLRVIQEFLGHENLATTQIYSQVSKQKIIDEYEKFHMFGKEKDV